MTAAAGLALSALLAGCTTPDRQVVALQRAMRDFVREPGGAPGIIVTFGHGRDISYLTAGVGDVMSAAKPRPTDHMRIASVAKAFSGATALALVADKRLALTDTIGKWLPDLPRAWWAVTLGQLLAHTSGVPDFSQTDAFLAAVRAAPQTPPPHRDLLSYVANEGLSFTPGTRYVYSNSDNVIVALMVEAATGESYEQVLADDVLRPLNLYATSLPNDSAVPEPYIRGYDASTTPPTDVTHLFAAGWAWASGGVVSTPGNAIRFIQGYVRGATTDRKTRAAQFTFRPGNSEPPGPGVNSAGLAIFRYETRCGTVYGHTGNTPGYTQFLAATATGRDAVSVAINAQITPKSDPARFAELRSIYELATCAALGHGR